MRSLINFLKPWTPLIVTAFLLLFFQANLELALPDLMSKIVNTGILQGRLHDASVPGQVASVTIQSHYIFKTGIQMLLFTLISASIAITVGFLASRTSAGLARNLRRDVFTRVIHFSSGEFDRFSTASLITRTTQDITQIQTMVFMMIRMAFYAPVLAIGGVIRAVGKAPSMAWMIGAAVLFLLGLMFTAFILVFPRFKLIQKLTDRLNRVARENLTGLMVVRAFNRQKFEEERFDVASKDLTSVNYSVLRLMSSMMPFLTLLMNGLAVAVIWVGAIHVQKGDLQVGDMMAFLQYSLQIIMSFLMLSMFFFSVPRAMVSLERVREVLNVEPSICNPKNPEVLNRENGITLEFRDVEFRYPGAERDALSRISFKAKPGTTTAIIGSTGSGKTTLASLIPRFYEVTGGSVLINDIDIRSLLLKDLRKGIGYVPQKSVLFSGTIDENLHYADLSANEERIWFSAKMAQAETLIRERPEALAAPVSQGGGNFSGGQKQRLAIARALVRENPLLVFDDSFSALDLKTDRDLRQALVSYSRNHTVLIIAQRISTIMSADQILVLDEGKIAGRGTHQELLKSCPLYREIADSQLTREGAK